MNKLLILLLFVCLASCKSSKIQSVEDAIIVIQKTPCMGTCPEYEMMIFENRRVVIEAKQHLPIKGKFRGELSVQTYEELIEKFEDSDFFEFEDRYTSNITDMPTTYLTYRSGDKAKKIMDYHGAPKALKDLENEVHGLIDQISWTEVKED
ncbi:MAG: DUF6438 domain-containing protein [Fulvivirga sp.]